MKIIIVGCGKVGTTLATQLSRENNEVCVIDMDRSRVELLATSNNIMGVCGNGSNYSTLMEAGIGDADLLIAVTGADELNLLCCIIAQKAGKCKVIARVRNPVNAQESVFLQKELGLSMIINPELLTAQEIFHVLYFPNATGVGFFSKGKVQMIRFKISQNSILVNQSLKQVSASIHDNILIGALERDNEVVIPNGDTILDVGDMVTLFATRKAAVEFFQRINAKVDPVKNTMIIGGGKIAVYLSQMLLKMGMHVKIIEQDRAHCEELSDILPDATIINGEGSDKELLKEERIDKMDSFVALTGFDEENILLSLFARKLNKKKVVTKINRFQLNEVVYNLDLDSVVYPKNLTSERILQYVRSTQNSAGGQIRTLYRLCNDQVEVIEFQIKEDSPLTKKALYELNLKKNVLIGCITRGGESFIPKGHDQIQVGDSIIVITTELGLKVPGDAMNR